MNSLVTLFQWLIEITPALTLQLCLILFAIKPAHRWLGSDMAYRMWILLLLWAPLSWLFANVFESMATNVSLQSGLLSSGPSTLLTNIDYIETVFPESGVRYGIEGNGLTGLWIVATGIWLVGIAFLTAAQILRVLSLKISFKQENKITPSKQLSQQIKEAGFPDQFEIRLVKELAAPALFGLTAQSLLIPEKLEEQFDSKQIASILRHEYIHYWRRDNLLNSFLLLVRNLLWFNPIVWIAYRRFRLDQELSCDQSALAGADRNNKARYAEALVEASSGRKFKSDINLTAWNDPHGIKERASMIPYHGRSVNKILKSILVGLLLLTGTTTGSLLWSQNSSTEGMTQAETISEAFLNSFSQYDQSADDAFDLETRSNELIPLDSEYLIFILDTSGSMSNTPGSWEAVQARITETIELYPNLQGVQFANDMGAFLFNSFRNEWIPPTTYRLSEIEEALRYWRPYSNSNPTEGLAEVLTNLIGSENSVSVYVIGDDLQQDVSLSAVMENIERYNQPISSAGFISRIHSIMLPNIFLQPERYHESGYRFANLMRAVAARNGGSFTLVEY